MNRLKIIGLTIFQLAKFAWSLPREAVIAVRQRRRRAVLVEREAERLDRIRNPSKYLGR